jgi:hypothetical protein
MKLIDAFTPCTDAEAELLFVAALNGYSNARIVPKHGVCGLNLFLFTVGVIVGIDELGYAGQYCYENLAEATIALDEWTGEGDPPGPWIKYKGHGEERLGPGALQ